MKSAISRSWRMLCNFCRILQTLRNRAFFHNLAYLRTVWSQILKSSNFIADVFLNRARERSLTGKKASRPYNNIGKHLRLINCNITFLPCYCECIRAVFLSTSVCLSVCPSVRLSNAWIVTIFNIVQLSTTLTLFTDEDLATNTVTEIITLQISPQ